MSALQYRYRSNLASGSINLKLLFRVRSGSSILISKSFSKALICHAQAALSYRTGVTVDTIITHGASHASVNMVRMRTKKRNLNCL